MRTEQARAADQVDIARRTAAAWNRGDVEAIVATLAADAEWAIAEENPSARLLRGRDEIGEYLADWLSTIDGLRYEQSELIDAGQTLISLGTMRGRAGDGPEVTARLALVSYFDGPLCVRVEEYLDHGRALVAAGVSTGN